MYLTHYQWRTIWYSVFHWEQWISYDNSLLTDENIKRCKLFNETFHNLTYVESQYSTDPDYNGAITGDESHVNLFIMKYL